MTGALWRLVRRLAAELGPEAADALLAAARAWMSDPADRAARERLLGQLTAIAARAGGLTAALAGSAARIVEGYRRGPGAWERQLMAARYAIPNLPTGNARAAALDTYLALTEAAPAVIAGARSPDRARREVGDALMLEGHMLRTEALGPRERELALEVNARIRAVCAAEGAVGA